MTILSDFSEDIDAWLSLLILRSIVESTLHIAIHSSVSWSDDWVEYYPVWTSKPVTREKTTKRIEIRLHGQEMFSSVSECQLNDHGLVDFDELLGIFEKTPARKINGVKYYLKQDYSQNCAVNRRNI
jgi:hypothetical protein